MAIDFSKTTLEYNVGFIDGVLWAVNSANKNGLNDIESIVENARKANDEKLKEDEKRFEQLKYSEVIK